MIYGDLQFFDIIIFAAIAGFIIYRLRSVLGKRTGFQKNISEPKPQETKKQEDFQKIPSLKSAVRFFLHNAQNFDNLLTT